MSEPKPKMLSVGLCRLCETGPLGLRSCGGCGRVVVLCDECDAAWPDGDTTAKPRLASEKKDGAEELPCPLCEAPLLLPPSRWATRDECVAEPWVEAALAAGEVELEEGEPLGDG